MTTVLVTGGAGFIGSHLVELLVAEGLAVRVLDNMTFGRREWLPAQAELMVGDIRDAAACEAACRGVDGVFHMAAMSRSAPSVDRLDECTTSNIVGTQNMLVAARDAGVRRFIYSASSTHYGSLPPPHVESMAPQFLNLYGLTKHVGEQYALLFDRLYGLPALSLRYFNVYGPRQPSSGAYALVLGIFLDRLRQGESLEIHGDGSQSRDFVHVRDVARANLMAWRSEARGEALNVGSGETVSVKALADRISDRQQFGPRRAADSLATQADITRIREVLGWTPTISLAQGIDELKHA